MSDILCIYYSRTGHTKQAMEEIAEALDAELVEIRDEEMRDGWKGFLRCGMDAMRKTTQPISSFQTDRALADYRLVILGTPVWGGRCSSVMRSFLKEQGAELHRTAYVLTRGSSDQSQEVYDQMDLYVPDGHQAAVSLQLDSVGYSFWKDEFLRQIRELLDTQEV